MLANFCAKTSKILIEKFKLGNGSALPGRLALAIDPQFLKKFQNTFEAGDYGFFVSGTNGKTTTAGLLASIVREASNQSVVSNAFGANLVYGIASELANSSDYFMNLKSNNFVFELDEAAFRIVSKDIKARAVVLTNIFRDQLDRFGEINATQKLLCKGLDNLKSNKFKTKLFLNINDQKISELAEIYSNDFDIYFYGTQNIDISLSEGHKSNTNKDYFMATLLERKINGSRIELAYKEQKIELFLNLAGDFNIHNACAAAAAAFHSGICLADIKLGLQNYKSAFGRGEKLKFAQKELNIFLIKNPAGATEVINFVSQFEKAKILIAINDNFADGKDISWLWDAGFENLKKDFSFICSGTRAYDMALRLKYAGVDTKNIEIESNIIQAIKKLASDSSNEEKLFIMPTYTCLLEINSKRSELIFDQNPKVQL